VSEGNEKICGWVITSFGKGSVVGDGIEEFPSLLLEIAIEAEVDLAGA
jgi:hypothetical protein